jgi:hypothetical protein
LTLYRESVSIHEFQNSVLIPLRSCPIRLPFVSHSFPFRSDPPFCVKFGSWPWIPPVTVWSGQITMPAWDRNTHDPSVIFWGGAWNRDAHNPSVTHWCWAWNRDPHDRTCKRFVQDRKKGNLGMETISLQMTQPQLSSTAKDSPSGSARLAHSVWIAFENGVTVTSLIGLISYTTTR